jgi:cytochrome P450
MDDPRHGRLRRLIQCGFTPRMIRQTEEWVRQVAISIVDELMEQHPEGECDAVEGIAGPLPLRVICRMMGIPVEDEPRVFRLTNAYVGAGDPEYADGDDPAAAMVRAAGELFDDAQALGEERRHRPRDDITTELMRAEVDGERLSTREFGCFILLLAAAGNETTRNAVSHGIRALTDHPGQRRIWWDDFDVRRAPNPHVALGGGGPHFCLGASLAREEIAVMFREIRSRLPGLHATGEPAMLRSDFVHGIKRMPCAWT